MSIIKPGVIWVSGFSGAGKSTIGREIVNQIKHSGAAAVFLDGDNLRSIVQSKWGFARDERIELARVYFQLSSYLAAQDLTVVVAAVALYDEVRTWIRVNIPNCLEVFLDVTEAERRRRDAGTKRVYDRISAQDPGYQLPRAGDGVLVLDNSAAVRPAELAARVIQSYIAKQQSDRSFGKAEHWNRFYRGGGGKLDPSPFAVHVAQSVVRPSSRVLEVGCGNGRDAAYFAGIGCVVTGLDASSAAIDRCRTTHAARNIRFITGMLQACDELSDQRFDVIYSRFVIHAMTMAEEHGFLTRSHELLADSGRLVVEARSINDPMALLGEAISPTERIHGHYRRFIVPAEFAARLTEAGFDIDEITESRGLAMFGDEDPVVLRVIARRRAGS